MGPYVIAVDVGTGSARAGLYDRNGGLAARAEHKIATWRSGPFLAQHDSSDIWNAVCLSVRQAIEMTGCKAEDIVGIGFDATCSLVVLTADGVPLAAHPDAESHWDIISWFDHRALSEADELNALAENLAGEATPVISAEMQLPKLLWLKRHHPETWSKAGLIMDLADFLTWRATGSRRRSKATLVTKWGYEADASAPWHTPLLVQSGLAMLDSEGLDTKVGIPAENGRIGEVVGTLLPEIAAGFGLMPETKVTFGMVDAFAGGLSELGNSAGSGERAALIGGTSTCLMWASATPQSVSHFWGPYRDALGDGRWITEGGQSAAGALLDHIVRIHGSGLTPDSETHGRILARVGTLLEQHGPEFANGIHVLPDFHGNRSPIGNGRLTGTIVGLNLDASFDGLCGLYWRAMVAIALGIRQILGARNQTHAPIAKLCLTGGHARNSLLTQLYADVTGLPVIISSGDEGMLLGTAMATSVGSGWYDNVGQAWLGMHRPETRWMPRKAFSQALDRDYAIFLKLQEQRRDIAQLSTI